MQVSVSMYITLQLVQLHQTFQFYFSIISYTIYQNHWLLTVSLLYFYLFCASQPTRSGLRGVAVTLRGPSVTDVYALRQRPRYFRVWTDSSLNYFLCYCDFSKFVQLVEQIFVRIYLFCRVSFADEIRGLISFIFLLKSELFNSFVKQLEFCR